MTSNSLIRTFGALVLSGAFAVSSFAQFPGGGAGGDRGGRGGQGGGRGGNQGGFGGNQGGFGGAGGGRPAPDPEMIWGFMSQGKDSINLNDPAHQRTKDRMIQQGQAIPANGILTKAEFKTNFEKSMAARAAGGATPMGGQQMTMSMTPGANGQMMMSTNGGPPVPVQGNFAVAPSTAGPGGMGGGRGGMGGNNAFQPGMNGGQPNWSGGQPPGGFNGGQPGGWSGGPSQGFPDAGNNGKRDRKQKDDEEDKPVVYRFGNMPKEIPSWFEQMDTDKDGQIGLYEWRAAKRSTAEFEEYDLDGDGYITAEEWLRKQRMDIAKKEDEEHMSKPAGMSSTSNNRGGMGGRSNFGSGGPAGGSGMDRGATSSKNPFTGGGGPPGGSPRIDRGPKGESPSDVKSIKAEKKQNSGSRE